MHMAGAAQQSRPAGAPGTIMIPGSFGSKIVFEVIVPLELLMIMPVQHSMAWCSAPLCLPGGE